MADNQAAQEQQELFQHVLGDQPVETPAPAPAPEPPPQPTEPPPAEKPAETPAEPVEAAIPSWRLREEAEARRAAEERARQLGDRLQQIEAHLRQNQKPQDKPDFFADPDGATQQVVLRHLAPFVQEMQRQTVAMGKSIADAVHGTDTVAEAEKAFLDAMNSEALDTVDYERVVRAPNRYDEVVKWHKRQTVLSSVGEDPNAWFEKQLETRMSDPTFQAKLLEKVRGDAAKRPSDIQLPPSLSRVTSAKGNSEPIGDLSNDSLFAYATKR
jgi:hypothetical protein